MAVDHGASLLAATLLATTIATVRERLKKREEERSKLSHTAKQEASALKDTTSLATHNKRGENQSVLSHPSSSLEMEQQEHHYYLVLV